MAQNAVALRQLAVTYRQVEDVEKTLRRVKLKYQTQLDALGKQDRDTWDITIGVKPDERKKPNSNRTANSLAGTRSHNKHQQGVA